MFSSSNLIISGLIFRYRSHFVFFFCPRHKPKKLHFYLYIEQFVFLYVDIWLYFLVLLMDYSKITKSSTSEFYEYKHSSDILCAFL